MTLRVTRGSVIAFDDGRGLGEVADEAGTTYPFHCVEIADGTRTIAVGTTVRFDVTARLGRYEAARVTPVSDHTSAGS
jgi:cold shock CspA family protein